MRHHAGRKHRSDRPVRGIISALAAIVVVVAVMVLWSPLTGSVTTTSPTVGPATTMNTTATALSASPAGSAILVVRQGGKAAIVALFCAGQGGGLVLGMPGITLLRSEDRFVELADAYSPGSPPAVATPIARAFAVPPGAVASIEWSDLRSALGDGAGGAKLPAGLDPKGADAGAVSAVLAATLSGAQAAAGAAGAWWGQAALEGEADGFRAAVTAAVVSTAGETWAGGALTGAVVEYSPGKTYLEPDVQTAISLLARGGGG